MVGLLHNGHGVGRLLCAGNLRYPQILDLKLKAFQRPCASCTQGVYSGGATSLALLQELASGPNFVVAAPLYNSLGNLGGT